MSPAELLSAVVSALKSDPTITAELVAGSGQDKVRYSRSLQPDANPIVSVDPSPSVAGPVPGSYVTLISFDSFARAEATSAVAAISDPMQKVIQLTNRIKDLLTGRRDCTTPKGILDSMALPDTVPFEQGEYWRGTVVIRFSH